MPKRSPWWLFPNLLSLDAPIVAVVWMWVLAQSVRATYVETSSYLLVAAAVWCVYVLDRIADVYQLRKSNEGKDSDLILSERHAFHWRHRWLLLSFVGVVVSLAIYTAFSIASGLVLTVGIAGVALVCAYLLLRKTSVGQISYLKNFAAGMIFAYGVTAPVIIKSVYITRPFSHVWHYSENVLRELFFMVIEVVGRVMFYSPIFSILLGLLFFFNITAIDLWERSGPSSQADDAKLSPVRKFLSLGLASLIAYSSYVTLHHLTGIEQGFGVVFMLSAVMLYLLNKYRVLFDLRAQRVLVDLILILPAPLIWLFA